MKKTLVWSLVYTVLLAGAVAAGEVAQDKAKAAKDRAEAKKLWDQAKKEHDDAAKDFEAGHKAYAAFLKDRHQARVLWHDAFLEDKAAQKEARKEAIEAEIAGIDAGTAALNGELKAYQDQEAHWKTQCADEQKSVNDLSATVKAEQNASIKAQEQGLLESTETELKNDQTSEATATNNAKTTQAEINALAAAKKQLEAELKKLG
jgi:chromosome segregation ATPase